MTGGSIGAPVLLAAAGFVGGDVGIYRLGWRMLHDAFRTLLAGPRTARPRCLPFAQALIATLGLFSGSIGGLAQERLATDPVQLPALGAELQQTSVSGLSSGAFMASQFHFANSRIVVGAGVVAGGPYACAEVGYPYTITPWTSSNSVAIVAMGRCMRDNYFFSWRLPSTDALERHARRLAREGSIDPLEGLARSRVYFFSGGDDSVVVPNVVKSSKLLYERLGVPPANLKSETRERAGHAFITKDKGAACGRKDAHFITNCDYDQAKDILEHVYGAPLREPRNVEAAIKPVIFDQRPFTRDSTDHGLDDAGFLYVPSNCRAVPGCRVHVVFHGCAQQRSAVGEAVVTDGGFVNWADANRLIVLFPQVAARPVSNPYGCWDWWGYTGRAYLTRNGLQMQAVRRMLERLAER
jgi:poly(3-hydroxybutyrate) depolymerase